MATVDNINGDSVKEMSVYLVRDKGTAGTDGQVYFSCEVPLELSDGSTVNEDFHCSLDLDIGDYKSTRSENRRLELLVLSLMLN